MSRRKAVRRALRARAKEVVFAIRSVAYRGSRRVCPCCGGRFRTFLPARVDKRPDAVCPRCGSAERHRLLWLYLDTRSELWKEPVRVLHVAPEARLARRLRECPTIDYVSGDIEGNGMMRLDLTSLPFREGSFDVVLCSHVLEHVSDDGKAIAELYRVTRGWGVLQVPIQGETTFEVPGVTDPEERLELFGQKDHVRRYGSDFRERLAAAGFDVRVETYAQSLAADVVAQYGLDPAESLFLVRA